LLRVFLAGALITTPMTTTMAQAQQAERADRGQSGSRGSLSVPVTGTVRPDANPAAGASLTGTFTIQKFVRNGQGVDAVGTLTASFTDPATNAVRTVVTQTSIPVDRQASGAAAASSAADADDTPVRGPAVAEQAAACDVLHLVLGPLDLNLLGLRVQLNQVVLDITAVPGAGNLLGNLLCSIVGILDPPGPLGQLVALLNGLLALLG
jgi:hypothetical protein